MSSAASFRYRKLEPHRNPYKLALQAAAWLGSSDLRKPVSSGLRTLGIIMNHPGEFGLFRAEFRHPYRHQLCSMVSYSGFDFGSFSIFLEEILPQAPQRKAVRNDPSASRIKSKASEAWLSSLEL